MARLRRMYARLLFVVVGIFGPVLAGLTPFLFTGWLELRIGIAGACGYTLAA
jgi:hypothetical protein